MLAGLYLLLGLVIVALGAEILVRGASRGAELLGMTPTVVGLTVVAFGTSAPELALSLFAVTEGQADLALGNVVGSNVFNVLFTLGLSALVTTLAVDRKLVRVDVPLMIAASVVVFLLALDGQVDRIEGAALSAALVVYLVFTIRQSRLDSRSALPTNSEAVLVQAAGANKKTTTLWWNGLLVTVGLALLTSGAKLLVMGAAGIARSLGLSELIIGLTVLAAGTSVPEVATSLVAALRGQRDIAVGNAIGSNIFNLLFVLGITALVTPQGVAVSRAALYFDLPVMLAAAAACLPIFFTGYRIDRWEGALLLGYYLIYLGYLILDATGHDATRAVGWAMLGFVIPLTTITLLVLSLRALGLNRKAKAAAGSSAEEGAPRRS